MFHSRVVHLLLAVILIAATLLVAPPVQAAACDWGSVNMIDFTELGGYNGSGTVKRAASIRKIITSFQSLAGNGFYTYRKNDTFVASDGTLLAANDRPNQWQFSHYYILAKQTNTVNDSSGMYYDELMTIWVGTHPLAAGKAYWFVMPDYLDGNPHPTCGAFETSAQAAADFYYLVSGTH